MLPILSFVPRVAASLLFLLGICGLQNLSADEGAISVKVADAVTYVNMAKVNLSVGTMTPSNGKLLGTYTINVPMAKSQAETGQIVLPLQKGVDEYTLNGGSISGKCTAEGKEQPHRTVEARFGAYDRGTKQGTLELTINTGVRILEFKSTYHLTGDGLVALN